MTIDLGFAFLNDYITIIDVPGHEKFIRNMVAGVSTIDVALLVVAADDGVMPQTTEHLEIMNLLGITSGVVALTKTDLIEDTNWLELMEDDVRNTLHGTFFENAPIIRTSIVTKSGIVALRTALITSAKEVNERKDRGYFRLPVDRVFSKPGFGTIVTGTVISGGIKVGDAVEVQPGNVDSKIRGIQSHGQARESVSMGDRAALNLGRVEKEIISRGTEISALNRCIVTDEFIGYFTVLRSSRWKIKNNQRLRLHFGTEEVMGRIKILQSPVMPGVSIKGKFSLESNAVLTMDDRFIMRSFSPMETLGGGVILDPSPGRLPLPMTKLLKQMPVDLDERFYWYIRKLWQQPKNVKEWSQIFQQPESVIQQLAENGDFHILKGSGILYHPDDLEHLIKHLNDTIRQFHEEHPYRRYISQKQLSDFCGVDDTFFSLALEISMKNGSIKQIESGYALSSHTISLNDNDQILSEKIVKLWQTNPFEAKQTLAIAEPLSLDFNRTQELMHVLKNDNKVLEVLQGWWLPDEGFSTLLNQLKQWFDKHEKLSVADFKSITGLSRKTAIPLLEYLDKIQLSERSGDNRIPGEKFSELVDE